MQVNKADRADRFWPMVELCGRGGGFDHPVLVSNIGVLRAGAMYEVFALWCSGQSLMSLCTHAELVFAGAGSYAPRFCLTTTTWANLAVVRYWTADGEVSPVQNGRTPDARLFFVSWTQ